MAVFSVHTLHRLALHPLTKALDVAFAADAFIPRRRVYRPDGSEGEATRKLCVSLRSLREAKGLLSARNKPNL